MAVKYKHYVEKMLDENKAVFDSFRLTHDNYGLNPQKYQDEFNLQGEKVLEIVREYEQRLCSNQERGMYNVFSGKLADKFQQELKVHFPLIDHIGLKTEKFTIKKISL